jgi:hypothetical protein
MAKTKEAVSAANDNYEEIFLPKRYPHDDEQSVGVNGKWYNVQRGKRVKVPRAVAAVLRESMAMEEYAQKFIDENAQY